MKKIKGGSGNKSFKVLKVGDDPKILLYDIDTQKVKDSDDIKVNGQSAKLEKLKNLSFKVKHFNEERNKGVFNPLTLPNNDHRSLLQHQIWMLERKDAKPISTSFTLIPDLKDENLDQFQNEFIKELFDSYKQKFRIINNGDDIEKDDLFTKIEAFDNNNNVIHSHEFAKDPIKSNNSVKSEIDIDDSTGILNVENSQDSETDDESIVDIFDFNKDMDKFVYPENFVSDQEVLQKEQELQDKKQKIKTLNNMGNLEISQIKKDTNDHIKNNNNNLKEEKINITAKNLKSLSHFMRIINNNKIQYDEHLSAIKSQIKDEKERIKKDIKEDNTGQNFLSNSPWVFQRKDPAYLMKTFNIPESYADFVSNINLIRTTDLFFPFPLFFLVYH